MKSSIWLNDPRAERHTVSETWRERERIIFFAVRCGGLTLRISGDDPPQKPDRTAAATVSYWLLLLKDYDVVVVGIITQRPSRMIRPIFPPPIYFQAPLLDAIHSYFFFFFPLSVFSPVNISLSSFSGGCAQNLCGGELLFLVPNDELGIGRDG